MGRLRRRAADGFAKMRDSSVGDGKSAVLLALCGALALGWSVPMAIGCEKDEVAISTAEAAAVKKAAEAEAKKKAEAEAAAAAKAKAAADAAAKNKAKSPAKSPGASPGAKPTSGAAATASDEKAKAAAAAIADRKKEMTLPTKWNLCKYLGTPYNSSDSELIFWISLGFAWFGGLSFLAGAFFASTGSKGYAQVAAVVGALVVAVGAALQIWRMVESDDGQTDAGDLTLKSLTPSGVGFVCLLGGLYVAATVKSGDEPDYDPSGQAENYRQ